MVKQSRIVSIKKIDRMDRYDVTVPETNNFFANGILIHNTSARTGYVKYQTKSFWNFLFKPRYRYVSGSRNVTYKPDGYGQSSGDGYYKGTDFRQKCHNRLVAAGLNKDEVIYYEIVGYTDSQGKIMPDHKLVWDDFKKAGFSKEEFDAMVAKYGETVSYTYGCKPGECKIYVYRIVQNGKDLDWDDVEARCAVLGVATVPVLETLRTNQPSKIMDIAKELAEKSDADGQLREGVCLRVEKVVGTNYEFLNCFKGKSHIFATLEGIKYTLDSYVDMEAIS